MDVFIADDSEIVADRLAAMLESHPDIHTQGHAQDADQAYAQIQSMEPDIVIADIHMPGNGFTLIERLKKEDESPTVIVLTNYPYPQYRQKSIQAGADFFFDKSTQFTNVIDVIRQLQESYEEA